MSILVEGRESIGWAEENNVHRRFARHELAVLRSINLLRANLSDQPTVAMMAEWAFFSKFHYTRVFQRMIGMAPGQFLSEYRMVLAEELLDETDLSFTEITYRVGYASVGTFSSRFKKIVGVPPTTFRQRRRRPCPPEEDCPRGEVRPEARMVLMAIENAKSVADADLPF
ncbi:helix-turn-helix transcriptional regulator [Kineosporia succinea]|uniref:AraC-like DNA-binding protein n=1 Tax=Kineosporia succinea TaxID=84632 RepID=A0ABT9PAD1_9ACTN|nr:AraC family transcriptional regulator [Kineosporia succinea]MDP9829654.1 AraC-like DNA-binding protein [Kineosporia succinea]